MNNHICLQILKQQSEDGESSSVDGQEKARSGSGPNTPNRRSDELVIPASPKTKVNGSSNLKAKEEATGAWGREK